MKFNYRPLWKLLERRGESKTQMRQQLGLSTATIAKLSSGESVAMDILMKIAKLYDCGLDDRELFLPTFFEAHLWANQE